MTEKYEYCITVPRTFVHDCSYAVLSLSWKTDTTGRFTVISPPTKNSETIDTV